MSKRILSLVLALTLVLGSMSMAFAADAPKDVVGTDVEDAVVRLGNLGILTGYEDGTFKPDNNITRAEFAAVVSRARGLEQAAINAKGKTVFGDVIPGGWASGYINVADDAGLIKGMGVVNGVNTFGPELNITYEQAVTMVVRALGYEPAAQANGGYPTGHLIVASQEGLLKDVKAVQGEIATRGLVAQLTDNALDIEKMIQVGYGDQAKFVKSGTEWTNEVYLFDDLGYDRILDGIITDADSGKQKVTIDGYKYKDNKEARAKSLKTQEGFNFAGLEGLKVTAWYNDSNSTLVDVRLHNDYEVKFDAIEITKDTNGKEEIELVKEDKKYDVSDKVKVKGNMKNFNKGDKYNFAKIVINEYNDVSWIEAYDLQDTIVVKEVKGDVVKGYSNEEIDNISDFTIVKDGKEISANDLEKRDVVLYENKEEYAVVVTDIRTGEIERVYNQAFKFEGETYDYNDRDTSYGYVKYIEGDDLEEVDSDVLEEMQDNGEVSIVFSFDDKPLLIDGEIVEVSNNYVMVEDTSKDFKTRGEDYKTLDILNSEGVVVKYEVKLKDIKDIDEDFLQTETNWDNEIVEGNVIKLTLDSKNKPTKVEAVFESEAIGNRAIDVDASYIEGFKVKSSAVVFWKDGESDVEDYEVLKWSEAKDYFTEIQKGRVYADKDGDVVAVYAEETNNETKTEDLVGVVRKVEEFSKKDDRYDITLEVNGREEIYEGKNAKFKNLKVDTVAGLKVTKDDEARDIAEVESKTVIVDRATGSRLTDSNGEVYNIRGKYYEHGKYELDDIKSNDIKKGDKVTLYFQPGAKTNVQVVILDDVTGGPVVDPEDPIDPEDPEVKTREATFVPTPFGSRVEFEMLEGETEIDSATVNGEATSLVLIEAGKGRVVVSSVDDVVKVIINEVEYTLNIVE